MDKESKAVIKHKFKGEGWKLWINKYGRRRKVSTKIESTIKKSTTGNKIIDYWVEHTSLPLTVIYAVY